MISGRRLDGVLALVLGATTFTSYAARAARDLGWVDSVELALAAATFGIPHPTGYPLYLLWSRLAFLTGGITGVNLLSAVFAALAVSVVYLAARALGSGLLGALVAALAFAMHPELVRQATVAEVYTLHILLVGLAVGFAARAGGVGSTARTAGGVGGGAIERGRSLLLLAFVLGLGLAHHLTIMFVVPALVVLALPALAPPARPQARWMAAALVLPLTLYLTLALRSAFDPVLDLGDPETPGRLLAHITGRQFRYRLLGGEPGYFISELAVWARRIGAEWPIPWLLLAFLGSGVLFVRRRRVLWALGLLASVTGAHAAAYRIPDKEPYFLPADLTLALLAGAGAEAVLAWLLNRWPGQARQRSAVAAATAAGIVVLAIAVPVITRPPVVDRHADRSLRDLAVEVLRRSPAGSLVLADDTSLAFALLYLAGEPGGPAGRTVVATYFLPLAWYARAQAGLDPGLPARAESMAQARRGLNGRALGDRLAADARELTTRLAQQAEDRGQPVRFTFHDFERQHPQFEGLALVDLGLAYALRSTVEDASLSGLDPEFVCLGSYTGGRSLTREERSLAKRLAAAANRSGIARVGTHDLAGAEAAFDRALALDSLYAQAWLNRGLLRAEYQGEPAAALADWRRYLALAEPGREAGAVRARVAALSADSARADSVARARGVDQARGGGQARDADQVHGAASTHQDAGVDSARPRQIP